MRRNCNDIGRIVFIFESLLAERGIQIMCRDRDEEVDRCNQTVKSGNPYCIYGTELQNIDNLIIKIIDEHDNRNNIILHNILQELLDKTFNYNYNNFESWLITEMGMTIEEIESLREVNLYVKDINGDNL